MMYARYGGVYKTAGALRLVRRAMHLGRHLRRLALWALLATVFATAARLAGPLVVRRGVDGGVLAEDESVITAAALTYVALLAVQYLSGRWSVLAVAGMGERFLRDLRVRVFEHMIRLDLGFFSRSKSGVLVSRMTSDIEALAAFAQEGSISVITSFLTVVGVTIALFVVDVRLALVVLGLLPALIAASIVFRHYANRAYQQIREQIGLVLGAIQEGLSGVRVVQAYTQERNQAVRFGRVNEKHFEANLSAARAISVYFPSVDFLRTAGIALILFVGGNRVLDGSLSFGSLIAFLLYLNWFFEPIVQLSNVYNLLQAAVAALAKLFEVLDRTSGVPEPEEPVTGIDGEGELRFDDVEFGYEPDVPVLFDVNVDVSAGERLAVVGETGAGKSTIAKLAVRFYDPDHGTLALDGDDLRHVANEDLRRRVVLVPQEGFLFSGSLRDNIRYGRPQATDDEVWAVCETLGIDRWVRSLPERLDTDVRERGSRLSAGERQLVALARALLADPGVIVLDEATSNLDPETEERVEAALSRLLEGRTALVIAHRLATARRADRVIVVDGGRIVEIGSHEELVAAGGRYARLAETWEQVGTQTH